MITVRKIEINDATALIAFTNKLDAESAYLLYDAGERMNDIEKMKSYLSRIATENKSAILIAENEDKMIIGFVCGEVSNLNRLSHVMKVNIGVLKKYHGLGIGTYLSNQLLIHARQTGIVRVECTVIHLNKISLNLFNNIGFMIEGIKKNSIKIDNKLYDEFILSLMIL